MRLDKPDSPINQEEFEKHHIVLIKALESFEQRFQKTKYLVGNERSFADIQAACELVYALKIFVFNLFLFFSFYFFYFFISVTRLWKEDLSRYPKVTEWLADVESTPKFKQAHESFVEFQSFIHRTLKWT